MTIISVNIHVDALSTKDLIEPVFKMKALEDSKIFTLDIGKFPVNAYIFLDDAALDELDNVIQTWKRAHKQDIDVPWSTTCTFEDCQHGHFPEDDLSYQVPPAAEKKTDSLVTVERKYVFAPGWAVCKSCGVDGIYSENQQPITDTTAEKDYLDCPICGVLMVFNYRIKQDTTA